MARNPEVSEQERATWEEPDWDQWLHLNLKMPKPDGTTLEIELLRPESWVIANTLVIIQPSVIPEKNEIDFLPVPIERFPAKQSSSPARVIHQQMATVLALLDSVDLNTLGFALDLNLPEMGAQGIALIEDILPVQEVSIKSHRKDQVVTATFRHPPSTTVLDVYLEGEQQPIGATDNHLFWSVEQHAFLPIGKMAIGERVVTYSGETKRIESKLARPGPELVYNLEVYGEHVYYVGGAGSLVHNSYLDDSIGMLKDKAVRFRNSPLLRQVKAIDPIDNVRKWMRTNVRLSNRRSTQALLDGDHILPKDPVRRALAGKKLKPGDAAYDEAVEFINTQTNLRPMTSNLNSSKKDLSILQWVKQGGLANSVDSRYLLRAAEIQRSNAIQVKQILQKHGVHTSESFLGDFISQLPELKSILN